MHQRLAQIFVPALTDAQKLRLAAGGELSRNQPQPGRKITAAREAFRSTDGGHKRRSNRRPDAGDRDQSPGFLVLFHPADELGVEGSDPSTELRPLRGSVGDQQDHAGAHARSALLVHQDGQELLELPLALRRDESALQQDGAQLID